MVEKENSSHEDREFVIPNPDDVYAKAGAMFQGAAWMNDAAYKQSDEVLAAAALIAEQHGPKPEREEHKLTKNEIDSVCSDIAAQCAAAGMSPDAIKAVIDAVRSAAASVSSAGELMSHAQAVAAEAMETSQGEIVQHRMYDDQQMQQQFDAHMQEINRLNDDIKKDSQSCDNLKTQADKSEEMRLEKEKDNANKAVEEIMHNPYATDEEKKAAIERAKQNQLNYDAWERKFAQKVIDDPRATAAQKVSGEDLIKKANEADKNVEALSKINNRTKDFNESLTLSTTEFSSPIVKDIKSKAANGDIFSDIALTSVNISPGSQVSEKQNGLADETQKSTTSMSEKTTAEVLTAGAKLNTLQMADTAQSQTSPTITPDITPLSPSGKISMG